MAHCCFAASTFHPWATSKRLLTQFRPISPTTSSFHAAHLDRQRHLHRDRVSAERDDRPSLRKRLSTKLAAESRILLPDAGRDRRRNADCRHAGGEPPDRAAPPGSLRGETGPLCQALPAARRHSVGNRVPDPRPQPGCRLLRGQRHRARMARRRHVTAQVQPAWPTIRSPATACSSIRPICSICRTWKPRSPVRSSACSARIAFRAMPATATESIRSRRPRADPPRVPRMRDHVSMAARRRPAGRQHALRAWPQPVRRRAQGRRVTAGPVRARPRRKRRSLASASVHLNNNPY